MPDGFQFQELAEIKALRQKEEKASLFEAVLLAEKLENPLGEKSEEISGGIPQTSQQGAVYAHA